MLFPTRALQLEFLNRALDNYGFYFRHFVWPTLNGHIPLADSPVIDFMCEVAQALYEEKLRFVTLSVPPRNTKTTIFTLGLPTWIWLKDPRKDILTCGASDDLILQFHTERMALFESEDYQAFCDILHDPEKRQWKKTSITKCDNGYIGQLIQWKSTKSRTGLGYHYGVLDDPISVADSYYQTYCERIYRETIQGHLNRRHNKDIGTESPTLIVQQRVSPHDLIGKFGDKEGWTNYALPAIAYEKQEITFPLSGRVWVREPGSVLNPDRESLETLLKIREADERIFWCQFQQNPAQDKSQQFVDPQELRYYHHTPKEFDKIILSVDSASSKASYSANWGLVVLGKLKGDYYVIFTEAKKYNFIEGRARIEQLMDVTKADELYIEDKSTGLALIPEFQELYKRKPIKVIAVQPGNASKQDRFIASLPSLKEKCLFPKLTSIPSAVWSMLLMSELTSFPNSPTQDLSDSLSQYFYHTYFKTKSRPSVYSFYGVGQAS